MATKSTPPQGVQQRREQERRDEKLAEINRQIEEGTLIVRQMTAAERAQHPKPAAGRPTRGKRR
jgi:hypothetical protein